MPLALLALLAKAVVPGLFPVTPLSIPLLLPLALLASAVVPEFLPVTPLSIPLLLLLALLPNTLVPELFPVTPLSIPLLLLLALLANAVVPELFPVTPLSIPLLLLVALLLSSPQPPAPPPATRPDDSKISSWRCFSCSWSSFGAVQNGQDHGFSSLTWWTKRSKTTANQHSASPDCLSFYICPWLLHGTRSVATTQTVGPQTEKVEGSEEWEAPHLFSKRVSPALG
ncbi:uncharacterized protein LOC115835992 [Nomascus leucogenys]|uniref:uncharacterized protein LOC115834108 n=1 Tax=Nomascus leucogenys TaxID=61853 RepID=UPI00122DA8ED|nr:uncharacterized protein LOC115834108 [Nomascus leucogenys]XP_030671803.1 uncharacterized protein LOC115835992 [Nomascus leucogenys]